MRFRSRRLMLPTASMSSPKVRMTTYGKIVGWKQLGPVEGSSEGNEGVKSKGRVAQSAISLKR